jgi:VanZ family protein
MKDLKQKSLIIWSVVVILLTLSPMPVGTISAPANSDKLAHIVLLGIFSFLVFMNLVPRFKEWKAFLLSVILSSIFAALIEIIQIFVPGRTSDFFDFLAGTSGAFIFALAATLFNKKK